MTLFTPNERACLDTAPEIIKQEPFGPYMKCVEGQCKCRRFKLTEQDMAAFGGFTAGMTTGEREAFMAGVKAAHQRMAETMGRAA